MALRPCALAALLLLGACAHGPTRPPTRTEALGNLYSDNAGLQVVTAGARVEQPLSPGLSVEVKALADVITLTESGGEHSPGTGDGHDHGGGGDGLGGVDAVSSASSVVAGGRGTTEQRFEGAVGFKWRQRVERLPVTLSVGAQGSGESDYLSMSGRVAGATGCSRWRRRRASRGSGPRTTSASPAGSPRVSSSRRGCW